MLRAKLKFRLLTSVLVLLWCGNFIALKVCLRFLSPFGMTTFRVVVAAIVLLVIYGFWDGRQSPRKLCRQDALDFLKLAFVGLFLNQTLFILGLSQTNVAHSALIVTFGPVFTLLFAWMRGQERLRRMTLLGMLVSVAGIALMNLEKDFTFQTRWRDHTYSQQCPQDLGALMEFRGILVAKASAWLYSQNVIHTNCRKSDTVLEGWISWKTCP
jgi:drug/metabolite transporter (DMT)-like permease